jgi:hypothetical protein
MGQISFRRSANAFVKFSRTCWTMAMGGVSPGRRGGRLPVVGHLLDVGPGEIEAPPPAGPRQPVAARHVGELAGAVEQVKVGDGGGVGLADEGAEQFAGKALGQRRVHLAAEGAAETHRGAQPERHHRDEPAVVLVVLRRRDPPSLQRGARALAELSPRRVNRGLRGSCARARRA